MDTSTVIYGILAAYVVFKVLAYVQHKYQAKRLGAQPIPHFGDGYWGFKAVWQMLAKKKHGVLIDFALERFSVVGRDTFTFDILGQRLITTRDPENIKALLATQFNDFALGDRHKQFRILLGDGIFTLDGTGWKHSRAMLRPQFAREQVSHVKALEPHIRLLERQIDLHPNLEEFDIQELFFRLTIDSATEFLFGESVGSLRDEAICTPEELSDDFEGKRDFPMAFNTSQSILSTRALLQGLYFLGDSLEFRRCNKIVHAFADHYVNKALNSSPEELDKASKNGYIFLYELVKQTRDPTVLRDQLLNILLAGRDTTAGLLSFIFFELARNQQVWNDLKKEIYEHFGAGDEARIEEITFESLKRCEYLKAVINEGLRMYPSVPQNFRIAQKNTTIPKGGGPDGQGPVYVKKGLSVVYSVYSTHRHEAYYGKDADTFRPERWFEPSTRKLGWAFVPFNGGPRICLGQQFALTEASYVIVRLLQIFPRIVSYDDEYPARKMSHLTMSHQKGVHIGLSK